jgi:hypothetical protein
MKISFGLAVFVLLFLAGCSPNSPETVAANHVPVPGDRAYYNGDGAVCPTKEVLSTWQSELLEAHNVTDRVGELNSTRKAFYEGCAVIPAQNVLILDVSVFSGIAEFRSDDGNAYWGLYSDLKNISAEKQTPAVVPHNHHRKAVVPSPSDDAHISTACHQGCPGDDVVQYRRPYGASQYHKDMRSMSDMSPAYQKCVEKVEEHMPLEQPNRDHTMMVPMGQADMEQLVHRTCDKFDR